MNKGTHFPLKRHILNMITENHNTCVHVNILKNTKDDGDDDDDCGLSPGDAYIGFLKLCHLHPLLHWLHALARL